VIQTVRERLSCRQCEAITQPPAPFHFTPRGFAGPSLLAMILFESWLAAHLQRGTRLVLVKGGITGIWSGIGLIVDLFTPTECQNCFAAAGYDAT
jgi:hypothetical protein